MSGTRDDYSISQANSLDWYQRPQNRQQDHYSNEDNNRQRNADFEVVDETITTWTHNKNIRGVRDWAREAC